MTQEEKADDRKRREIRELIWVWKKESRGGKLIELNQVVDDKKYLMLLHS